jgi:hypothetical protein
MGLRRERLILLIFVFFVAAFTIYPEQVKSNYYLGILSKGYPHNLIISEFKFANAQVVSIKDNILLFGINENTKLTTFFKKLPFLKEVYADAEGIRENQSLKRDPIIRKFLSLVKKNTIEESDLNQPTRSRYRKGGNTDDKLDKHVEEKIVPETLEKRTSISGNMALIDKLIREKAKKGRSEKDVD